MKRIFFAFIASCSMSVACAMQADTDKNSALSDDRNEQQEFIKNCKEIVLYRNAADPKFPVGASLKKLDLSSQGLTSDTTIEDQIAVQAETWRLKVKKDANPEIVKRIKIKYFDLGKNNLEEFPKQFLGFVSTMIGLDLSSNIISKSPELKAFSDLRVLILKDNTLKILSISDLPHLGRLIASNNQIEKLEMANLPALEELCLPSNRLKNLSDSFSGLTELKKLNVSFNEFEGVPSILSKMKHLKTVDIVQANGLKVPIDTKELAHIDKLTVSSKDCINKSPVGKLFEGLFVGEISNYEKSGISAKVYEPGK